MNEEMDLIIKNGTIITASESYKADIAVKKGKIAMISENVNVKGERVVDAAGKLVLPGAIDTHVHFELPVGETVSADNYESGTRAAACGGTTMIIDFATQEKGMGLVETVHDRLKHIEPKACVDYSFHIAITDLTDKILDEFKTSAEFGIPSFKLYMVYDNMMVDDGAIADALERSKETGVLIAVHAENPYLINRRIKKLLSQGKTSAWYHYESRPELVEVDAVRRMVYLAKSLKAPLYIVHLASREGLDEIIKARDEGLEIYAETCPHYLNFTNEVYKREDGRNFICSPAIKGEDSRKALWEGLRRGYISTVATDHCPFKSYEKDWGKDDFTKTPNGCMGVENMYPYMLSEANKGQISFNKVVEVCSENVAKIFGCSPQKGTIAVGSDADIVIYDPKKKFIISKENMHSDVDYTIWENCEMTGYPIMTFSRGRLVYEEGSFTGEPGWGRFVKCYR